MKAMRTAKKNIFLTTTVLFAAVLCLASAAPGKSELLDGIAVVVNDRVILVSDINKIVGPMYQKLRRTYSDKELKAKLMEHYAGTRKNLIERQLILSSHENPNPQALDAIVDERMDGIVHEQFEGNRSAFLEALASGHVTLEEWRNEMSDHILVKIIQRREIADKVVVSPGAIRRRYEANIEKFKIAEKVRLRMIVLQKGTVEKDVALKREQAKNIGKRLVDGADFVALARDFSEDTKANSGGDWGWLEYDVLKAELARVVSKLKAGEVSEVIEMDDAFYILKVDGRRGASVTPLDEVREEINRELNQEAFTRLHDAWISRLRKRSYIKVFE